MIARPLILVIAFVSVPIGAVLSWRATTRKQEAVSQLATVIASTQSTRDAVRALDARIAETRRSIAEVGTAQSRPPDAATARPAAVPPLVRTIVQPRPDSLSAGQQASRVVRFREGLVFDYFPLYRSRSWSREQIARFEDILTAHEGRTNDILATAQASKLSRNDPAIAPLRREEDERFKAELTAAFGDDGRRAIEDYQARAPERRIVNAVVGAAALTASPLTPPQVQQFIAAVRAHDLARRREQADAWDAVVAQTAPFLDPIQTAELQAQAMIGKSEGPTMGLIRMIEAHQKAKTAPTK
jgi:hypothetical protein